MAREAAREAGDPDAVGHHLGVEKAGDRLVIHRFASTQPGYPGWEWQVVVGRAPRRKVATVSEVNLCSGEDALTAPPWLPWAERLQPGDVGGSDILPKVEFDDRLEQGYEATGEKEVDRIALWELGLGRPRVLTPAGRVAAASRWRDGALGSRPRGVDAPCRTCGFWLVLPGSMRLEFGVCANEWATADGQVTSRDYGCGAHSETDVSPESDPAPEHVLDETGYDPVEV